MFPKSRDLVTVNAWMRENKWNGPSVSADNTSLLRYVKKTFSEVNIPKELKEELLLTSDFPVTEIKARAFIWDDFTVWIKEEEEEKEKCLPEVFWRVYQNRIPKTDFERHKEFLDLATDSSVSLQDIINRYPSSGFKVEPSVICRTKEEKATHYRYVHVDQEKYGMFAEEKWDSKESVKCLKFEWEKEGRLMIYFYPKNEEGGFDLENCALKSNEGKDDREKKRRREEKQQEQEHEKQKQKLSFFSWFNFFVRK